MIESKLSKIINQFILDGLEQVDPWKITPKAVGIYVGSIWKMGDRESLRESSVEAYRKEQICSELNTESLLRINRRTLDIYQHRQMAK